MQGCLLFDEIPPKLTDDTTVQAVEEKIVGSGGNFVMQMAPKVKSHNLCLNNGVL